MDENDGNLAGLIRPERPQEAVGIHRREGVAQEKGDLELPGLRGDEGAGDHGRWIGLEGDGPWSDADRLLVHSRMHLERTLDRRREDLLARVIDPQNGRHRYANVRADEILVAVGAARWLRTGREGDADARRVVAIPHADDFDFVHGRQLHQTIAVPRQSAGIEVDGHRCERERTRAGFQRHRIARTDPERLRQASVIDVARHAHPWIKRVGVVARIVREQKRVRVDGCGEIMGPTVFFLGPQERELRHREQLVRSRAAPGE